MRSAVTTEMWRTSVVKEKGNDNSLSRTIEHEYNNNEEVLVACVVEKEGQGGVVLRAHRERALLW